MATIAYILHTTTPYGGATRSFLALLKGVMANGITPLVIVPDSKGIFHNLSSSGVEVYVVTYRPNVYPWTDSVFDWLLFLPRLLARQLVNRRATSQLCRLFSQRHVSLVHTNVSIIDIGFRAAQRLDIPHIYHFREYGDCDFNMHYFPRKASLKKQMQQPRSYAVCITRDIQHYHHLDDNNKSVVVYNPIRSYTSAPPHTHTTQPTYFLFVGRLEEAKGLDILLQAWLKAAPSIPLYIAGETMRDDYLKSLHDFVDKHNLQQSIRFLGQRNDTDELMQQARALIVPSRFEAFGRCTAEAMFNGCLVIGRNTGGTREQFDNGLRLTGHEIGLRFEDSQQLADCLNEALAMSKDEYDALTARAFKTVNQLYTVENSIEQIISFYQQVTNNSEQ